MNLIDFISVNQNLILSFLATGIGASILTELVSWINKILSGNPLKGDGALISALIISFLGGLATVVAGGVNIHSISGAIGFAFLVVGASQGWFHAFGKYIPWLHIQNAS